ncbi:hypothetical protein [Paenibacillus ihbetae]|uniref:Uncharacterized protein n=1 Tax=Paenibacillus ihbetae TaxID=1870820 RepID=A0ABX3JPR5_9BACL|nr:hypothetical protein [Paenibacillus ihbetae]OOC58410.1 hypothetical protein BBD40_22065 [Paenibacillus ihbetae]
MSSIQQLQGTLNQLSGQLAAAEQSGSMEDAMLIVGQLGQLQTELQNAQSGLGAEASDSARQELVNCRMLLHGMMNAVEAIRARAAEQYRQVLGENKAAFEQMADDAKQSVYPEAYQYRQVFQQMAEVSQQLRQWDGTMLDMGYQMERGAQTGGSLNGAVPIEETTMDTHDGWTI